MGIYSIGNYWTLIFNLFSTQHLWNWKLMDFYIGSLALLTTIIISLCLILGKITERQYIGCKLILLSSLLNIYKNSYWYIYLVHGFCHLYWNGIEIFLRWNYWDHFLPHLWFFSRKMPFPSIGMVKLVSSNTDRGIRIRKFIKKILIWRNKNNYGSIR